MSIPGTRDFHHGLLGLRADSTPSSEPALRLRGGCRQGTTHAPRRVLRIGPTRWASPWLALALGVGLLVPLMLASTADASSGIVPDDFPTIQRALDQAMPGDVIQVKDGTYFEKVRFIRSGNAADGFITLQPFPGHRPILDGTDVPGTHMVLIDSVSYVQLIGFELRNNLGVEDGSGVRILGSGSHIEIRRNRIHDIRGIDAMGITVYGTSTTASISDLVIDQNELYDLEPAQSEALTLNGNIERFVVSRNTVRDVNSIGIDFIGGELDINPDPTKVPRNGVCRFNQVSRAHANYGGGFAAGIYVDGGRNLVVENNIVSGSDIGIEVGAENAGVVASGVIIRNNLVYGNDKPCLVFGGFDASVGRVRNSQFLNNTCHKNDRVATGVGELWIQHAENNIVRGNVFVGRGPELLLSEDGAVDNSLDYNLWFTPTGELVARFTWEGTTYEGYAAYQAGSEQDRRSPFADPLFVHAAGADFHLRPGSPAIDVGDPAIVPAVGELDMDLEARRMGPRVDIGADEFRPPGCVYSLTPLGRAFHRQGGLGTVTVEAPVGCSWTALSLDDWITVAEVTGDNSGLGDLLGLAEQRRPLVPDRYPAHRHPAVHRDPTGVVVDTDCDDYRAHQRPHLDHDLDIVDPVGNRVGRRGVGVGHLGK